MRYLIDTNCCIYLFSGQFPVLIRKVGSADSGEIALSVIVLAELGVGARLGKAPDEEGLMRLRSQMPLLSFEAEDAEAFAALPFRRGRFDRLLAAHALSRGLILITNNEADFADVPGLRVENWTRP
ncbi:MAG TPA: type II toxin-antitoxin system VapC family toxin [Sphingomonas sp.]|nr:type II toxin-antitoxin system VapC family toxin [Sphingomonas sp.]